MDRYPFLTDRPAHENDDPGYAVACVLDEIVSYAREHGCSEDELRERLEEALEKSEEADS